MKERKLKLATMIVTVVFGLACIGVGVVAATSKPNPVSNTSKIDLSVLGEPQADITIVGRRGSVANNNPGQQYLYPTSGGAATINNYYVSLDPETTKTSYDTIFSGAETLLSVDGLNPPEQATFDAMDPTFSSESGYSYVAYKITITCLQSTNIRFSVMTSRIDSPLVAEEVYIQGIGAPIFVTKNNKATFVDEYTYLSGVRSGTHGVFHNLAKGQTATVSILLKTTLPLNEIYADGQGAAYNFAYDIGLRIIAA